MAGGSYTSASRAPKQRPISTSLPRDLRRAISRAGASSCGPRGGCPWMGGGGMRAPAGGKVMTGCEVLAAANTVRCWLLRRLFGAMRCFFKLAAVCLAVHLLTPWLIILIEEIMEEEIVELFVCCALLVSVVILCSRTCGGCRCGVKSSASRTRCSASTSTSLDSKPTCAELELHEMAKPGALPEGCVLMPSTSTQPGAEAGPRACTLLIRRPRCAS